MRIANFDHEIFGADRHPLYTARKRKGKTGDMIDAFREIFEKYKVDAYFCGHAFIPFCLHQPFLVLV